LPVPHQFPSFSPYPVEQSSFDPPPLHRHVVIGPARGDPSATMGLLGKKWCNSPL
jgi:hypothetical protein